MCIQQTFIGSVSYVIIYLESQWIPKKVFEHSVSLRSISEGRLSIESFKQKLGNPLVSCEYFLVAYDNNDGSAYKNTSR